MYYRVIKDIDPGQELLVHVKEGAYALGTAPPGLDGEPPRPLSLQAGALPGLRPGLL